MRNPGALALFVVPVLVASTPAWCCTKTLTMENFFMPGIAPGAVLLLPTNVQLLRRSFGDSAAIVDAAGDRVAIDLEENPLLKLELLPNSTYTLESEALFEPCSFSTGAGPDTEPPPAPDVNVIARPQDAVWSFGNTCIPDRSAYTRYDVYSDDEEHILAVVRGDNIERAGTGSLSIRDYDGTAVNTPVSLVAMDLAGNRSPEIEVDLSEAEHEGGCAQASPASMSPLLALGLLLWRRRQQGSRSAQWMVVGVVLVAGASGCALQPLSDALFLCVEQESGADVEFSPPVVSFTSARVVPAADRRLGAGGSLCGDAGERVELEVADGADRRAWFAVTIADEGGRAAPDVDLGALLANNAVVDVEANFQVGFPDFGTVTVSDAAGPVFVAEQVQPVEPHTRGGVDVSLGATEGLALPTACGNNQHHALRVEADAIVEILHGDSAVVDVGADQLEVHNVRSLVNTGGNLGGCPPDSGTPDQLNWYAARR
jgi:hypothetical protein